MLKRFRIWGVLVAVFFGLGLQALVHSAGQQSLAVATNQRIITFRQNVGAQERARIVQAAGGVVVHDLGLINAVAARFPSKDLKGAESSLKGRAEVTRIENDLRIKWIETSVPTFADVEFPAMETIIHPFKSHKIKPNDAHIPWGVKRVNAPNAWNKTRGKKVKVAIIDTGIDYKHSQLKNNVKGGINLVSSMNTPKEFMDDNGHGTHVSGTIAAYIDGTPTEKSVVGVAPEATLYGVKVLDAEGSGTFSDVIAGIQWAADNHMDVANMSLGASSGTDALAEVVKKAIASGLVIIAAAGNSYGDVGYPAAYPEVIAISALDNKDHLADFSSRGPQVAFTAPGVDVPSTWMGDGYNTISGTSMACPHAVGLAALVISKKHVHGHDAVLKAMKRAAVKLPGLTDEQQGAGLIDAKKLVK